MSVEVTYRGFRFRFSFSFRKHEKRKLGNLPPVGSSQACDYDGKLSGAEYTFYCGCAAKVGGVHAHTCVRACVRDRASAKPRMFISL